MCRRWVPPGGPNTTNLETPPNYAIPLIVSSDGAVAEAMAGQTGVAAVTIGSRVTIRLVMSAQPIPKVQSIVGEANRSSGNGTKLSFIPPILKNETPTTCLQPSSLELEANKWVNAIILYVIGDVPNIKYVNT